MASSGTLQYPKFKAFVPGTGTPAAGYKVQTFQAGTTTPLAVFTDAGYTTPAANPFVLDSNGEALVYAQPGVAYKVQFQDSLGTPQWTVDNVLFGGSGGSSTAVSEWITDGATPTFLNATQFTLPTDRTGTYHVNRRIRTANTGGTIYSTITAASFSVSTTTITVSNDSGALDSGLSAVAYGILDSINVSYPATSSSGGSKNLLYNGGFDIWQRGAGGSASFTAISARTYTADRWQAQQTAGSCAVTQSAGIVSRYGAKLQRTNGTAGTNPVILAQSLEINDCARLGALGTPLTLAVNLKAGANFSAASGNVTLTITAGKDVSDTNVLAGYTSPLTVATATFAVTATSTRYSISGTVPGASGYTEFGVQVSFTPVGTAGADDSVLIESAQLEPNGAATSFEVVPFGQIYQRCLRYYQKSFPYNVLPAQNSGTSGCRFNAGKAGAVAGLSPLIQFLAPVRTLNIPTMVYFNTAAANAQIRDTTAAADCSATATSGAGGDKGFSLSFTGNAGTAVGNALDVNWTADADIA